MALQLALLSSIELSKENFLFLAGYQHSTGWITNKKYMDKGLGCDTPNIEVIRQAQCL